MEKPTRQNIYYEKGLSNHELVSQLQSRLEKQEMKQSYLVWSIMSMVLFIPLFILWFPALVYSIKSKKSYYYFDNSNGSWYAKVSMLLNLSCLIVGLIGWLLTMIIAPMFLTQNYTYHIIVIFVPPFLVFILHAIRVVIVYNF